LRRDPGTGQAQQKPAQNFAPLSVRQPQRQVARPPVVAALGAPVLLSSEEPALGPSASGTLNSFCHPT
jgi:hypothetical protein